jgi:hypothetical protein
MNERIRLLAEQAGWDSHHSKFDTRIEKFAELIIRECIDTVSECSVEYYTRPQIISEIKQYFGV